ncbi:hypothetical protein ACFO3J_33460 [Streptomyces polygonati]|uniref:Uncharacterized protein n=1 Tax=Streptomyces polygonati TaxID=1617087 RepID=A0ABV8I2N8_9ACTN
MAVNWTANAVHTARWERTHGLLLWWVEVAAQPLGKVQLYYSSVRRPAPASGT